MKSEMENDILKVLITEEELQRRIGELGGPDNGPLPVNIAVLGFIIIYYLIRQCFHIVD